MFRLNKLRALFTVFGLFAFIDARNASSTTWYDDGNASADTIIQRKGFETIPSTQLYSRKQADNVIQGKESDISLDAAHWTLVTAEEQTAGVGTQNRSWVSPPKVNIYATYTFLIPASKSEDFSYYLTRIAILSVAQTLEQFHFSPAIKWVNDLLLNGKKVCGALCEYKGKIDGAPYGVVLVGVGVNVNAEKKHYKDLNQPVTSLKIESGKEWDKEEILKVMNQKLLHNFGILLQKGFQALQPELAKRIAYRGETISIEDDGKTYKGIFKGLTKEGAIELDLGSETKTLFTGHIVKQQK